MSPMSDSPQSIAVVAATGTGSRLARDLARHLGARVPPGRPAAAVAGCWSHVDALVLVMATGAATRLIAPHLRDKRTDPAVVCVDDAGRFAIPLTGAHERGGNALAGRLARFLVATAVVTTASEAAGHPALATLGARFGLRAEGDLAAVGAHVLAGGPVRLRRDLPWPLGPVPAPVSDDPSAPLLWLTDRTEPVVAPVAGPVVRYRPPSLVVGVGAARGVDSAEVGALVDTTLAEAGLSPRSVALLATVEAKAGEAGITEAAAQRGWQVSYLSAERLAAIEVPHPSEVVRAAVGTPSVAEAAALHLGGELLVTKRRSAGGMATVAVARRPSRGRLALLSLGPGAADLVPPRVRDELAVAEVVIGYRPYVAAAERWTGRGAVLEHYRLGEELARADRALALARAGQAVALVGSGDVGVYAMASPALERAAQAGGQVDVVVVPGVTAALAASALLGAPLGHDHCVISLSDLLTDWQRIARRVEAAARADLVVVFYNPRSSRRDWQLGQALAILRAHRDGATPVGVVHDAERPSQQVIHTTLAELDPADVHMRSIVLVGSTRTRQVAGRMVTPRDYPEASG